VVKAGAIQQVKKEPTDKVNVWPHLLIIEFVALMVVTAALFVFSVFVDAPLLELANFNEQPNPSKAPWYFLGLQELVHYGALFGGVVVPTAMVLALLALPYVDNRGGGVGVWFAPERRRANVVFGLLALAVVVLTIVGTFFRGPNWAWVWPWVS